jgi:hypothetical protein
VLIKKEIVTDSTFEKFKIREDDLNEEFKTNRKRKRRHKNKKFEVDESFSFDEMSDEDAKQKSVKFRQGNDISGISYTKTEESDDELVTEEMFQRALAATRLELESKTKRKKGKSRMKVSHLAIIIL